MGHRTGVETHSRRAGHMPHVAARVRLAALHFAERSSATGRAAPAGARAQDPYGSSRGCALSAGVILPAPALQSHVQVRQRLPECFHSGIRVLREHGLVSW